MCCSSSFSGLLQPAINMEVSGLDYTKFPCVCAWSPIQGLFSPQDPPCLWKWINDRFLDILWLFIPTNFQQCNAISYLLHKFFVQSFFISFISLLSDLSNWVKAAWKKKIKTCLVFIVQNILLVWFRHDGMYWNQVLSDKHRLTWNTILGTNLSLIVFL